jgi:hypothetical protein
MALFLSGEDTTMKTSRSEFEGAPAPPNAQTPPGTEPPVRAEIRASPKGEDANQRDEEPPEEPGYGHGV